MRVTVTLGHSTPLTGMPTSSTVTSPLLRACVCVMAMILGLVTPPARASNGQVTGTVTINGAPTAAVRVAAFAVDQDNLNESPAFEAVSRRDGTFSLRVAPGEYRVVADAGDHGYRPAWWRGPAGVDVAPVQVAEGGIVSDIALRIAGTPVFPIRSASIPVPATPAGVDALPLDELAGYQGQTRCRRNPRPGTVLLRDLILATYTPIVPAYLNRDCAGDTSEHYDGRAIDWMVNSRVAAQAQLGDAFAAWVTAGSGPQLGGVARRMGIMYIIWRGRIWKQYQAEAGWQPYSDCTRRRSSTVTFDNECHRNHIHISLTHDGARKRTSWWRTTALQ